RRTEVGLRRGGEMKSPDAPIAKKGFLVAHFLTVKDQARSKEFYVGILGGKLVKPENPCYIKLENSWSIRRRRQTTARSMRRGQRKSEMDLARMLEKTGRSLIE